MSALAVMPETLLVGGRFAGPPGNGNGGYSCGRFARLVDGPAEVTLRGPVPLERRLDVRPGGDGTIEVADGEALVAVVCSIEPLGEIDPPVRPAPAEALECAKRSPFLGPLASVPGLLRLRPRSRRRAPPAPRSRRGRPGPRSRALGRRRLGALLRGPKAALGQRPAIGRRRGSRPRPRALDRAAPRARAQLKETGLG